MDAPLASRAVTEELRDRRARRICWWWAGASACCAAFLLVLVESRWAPLRSADRSVASGLHGVAVEDAGFTHANRVLTDWVWDPITMRLIALAMVGFLVLRRVWLLALWVAATSALGYAVQVGVKVSTARARPRFADPVDSASGWAFPSGHAMTAVLTCGALACLFVIYGRVRGTGWARWQVAGVWAGAAVSVVGVGFTRVFLGVHWWTDVVEGWLLGGAILALCAAAMTPWRAVPTLDTGEPERGTETASATMAVRSPPAPAPTPTSACPDANGNRGTHAPVTDDPGHR